MTAYRVTLVVEGMDHDDGHVRLEVFVNELQKLQAALARADRSVADGQRHSYFAVVGLSHSSPATVELEARVLPSQPDSRKSAVALLANAIRAVERGEFNADSDPELLVDIKELASPVGAALRSAYLVVDGASHYLTANIATNITAFLDDQEECMTTVEGMLERINLHDGANEFTIFPQIGAKRIKCRLPPRLAEKGISGIRRRVAVSGRAKYRKFASFPHEIEADDIEIYGLEGDLPTFDDLRGLAPDATGQASSEEFVREVRNGWR